MKPDQQPPCAFGGLVVCVEVIAAFHEFLFQRLGPKFMRGSLWEVGGFLRCKRRNFTNPVGPSPLATESLI